MTQRQSGGASAGHGNQLEHVRDIVGGDVYYTQASHELKVLDEVLARLSRVERTVADREAISAAAAAGATSAIGQLSTWQARTERDVAELRQCYRWLPWLLLLSVINTVALLYLLAQVA